MRLPCAPLLTPCPASCTPTTPAGPPRQGFFLLHYAKEWRRHLRRLAGLVQAGNLRVQVRRWGWL